MGSGMLARLPMMAAAPDVIEYMGAIVHTHPLQELQERYETSLVMPFQGECTREENHIEVLQSVEDHIPWSYLLVFDTGLVERFLFIAFSTGIVMIKSDPGIHEGSPTESRAYHGR